MRWVYTAIWNLSEWSGIGLGKYAPYVFKKIIGIKGQEVDSLGKAINKEGNNNEKRR